MRAVFADDTGSMLVDAMVGVIVTAVTLIGLATLAVTTSNALAVTANQKQRQSYLDSYVSDQAMDPLAVPTTPATATQTVNGAAVPVTVWRQDIDADTSMISAAMPAGNGNTDCADPSTARAKGCVTSQVTVPTRTGITTTSVNPTWTNPAVATPPGASVLGPVGSFTVPGGVTEVRYVVLVSGATGNGSLTFAAGASQLAGIPYAAGTNQYFYGSLAVTPGASVTITTSGASANLAHFYIYQAAQ